MIEDKRIRKDKTEIEKRRGIDIVIIGIGMIIRGIGMIRREN